jgi:hypothetical protein
MPVVLRVQSRSSRRCQPAHQQLSLDELPLTLPPLFVEACGYRGKARYVALCWIPDLGELWWSDNGEAVLGVESPFLALCRHPATADALSGYRSAGSADTPMPWLLVDRGRRALSMGAPGAVWRIIEAQADELGRARRPAADPLRQRELERTVGAWLDWMAQRKGRG